MPVRIESVDRLSVGDHVDHDGAVFVVTEVAVWSDAWGAYAHTAATLEPLGSDDGHRED
jgi:hypothetical protein